MVAFPPFMLPLVFLAAMLTRTRPPAVMNELSIPLFASQIFIYIALSFAYLTLNKKGQTYAAWSAAILADGLLLVSASAQIGAGAAFGWGGVALIILGLILATSQITTPQAVRFTKNLTDLMPETVGKPEIKLLVSAISFPTAFIESDDSGHERIVAANNAFGAIVGRSANKLEGIPFEDIISPNAESRALVFAGAEWVAHRTTRGKQTMFMLSPAIKINEAEPIPEGEFAIVDTESGLYTSYYMKYKAESDVQACRRYKRCLSVLLFRLGIESKNLIPPSDETIKTAFAAFARTTIVSIRNCDSAYRVNDGEIAVFLPDTPQQGAKIVLTRIVNSMKKIGRIEIPELGAAHLSDAMIVFFGDELSSLDQVMKDMYIEMERNNR
jgi:GGDEF domain-containing protein